MTSSLLDRMPAPYEAGAAFDAIAHQIADVFEAMERDSGQRLDTLRADGGASANDWLMQIQADLLGRPVIRRDMAEIGARGVAAMALSAMGKPLPDDPAATQTFTPQGNETHRQAARRSWRQALGQARCRAD